MSLTALWLCLRGLAVVVVMGLPEVVVWGDCGVDEDAVGALGAVVLLWSPAHDKTDDSESFLCGWRRPSGLLCFESLASFDMASAGKGGEEKRRRNSHGKTIKSCLQTTPYIIALRTKHNCFSGSRQEPLRTALSMRVGC